MRKTTGERKSIFMGRAMARRKTSLNGSPLSSLERSCMFPVSFWRRAVFWARILEWNVSRPTRARERPKTPPKMARIQNTQRQDMFSTRKPPHTGPMMGPSKGPME
jgi:hypothetical protein